MTSYLNRLHNSQPPHPSSSTVNMTWRKILEKFSIPKTQTYFQDRETHRHRDTRDDDAEDYTSFFYYIIQFRSTGSLIIIIIIITEVWYSKKQ